MMYVYMVLPIFNIINFDKKKILSNPVPQDPISAISVFTNFS